MNTALVVEDCLTDRETLAICLHQNGFEVITAASSEEAREKISNYKPDVIVLDVVLPGHSGFELCRELKANPESAKIPVVFCSNKATKLDEFWGLKQGAQAYLTKPVIAEKLISIIKQVVRGKTQSV
jgi:chemotaxis family two-component system response regulator PixH